MIIGINHKAFHVVDMERSLEFYCDKLGFKKTFELKTDEGEPWIVYLKIAEGSFIELFYGGEKGPRNRSDHICFEVVNIHETAEEIKSKGITLASDVKKGKSLDYQFWIQDPDDNWLEFMEISPESLQRNS